MCIRDSARCMHWRPAGAFGLHSATVGPGCGAFSSCQHRHGTQARSTDLARWPGHLGGMGLLGSAALMCRATAGARRWPRGGQWTT
eukprot:4531824-Lingulodinium_polyedra.AAC.1